MKEFEPKLKKKRITKTTVAKYAYILVIGLFLMGGISYGYTFFNQNKKIASGSIVTANLNINFSDRNINASDLVVPSDDVEGINEFSKLFTITNTTNVDGVVKIKLVRSSGLNLTDLRYAIVINGSIQTISNIPANGEILSNAIMGNEVINMELRLWPKTTYTGSDTTFVGTINTEVKYLGKTAASIISNPTGKYVEFNCSSTCENWQIVKVENNRLVLTRQEDYSGASSRINSNRYNSSLTFNDNSMITSVSVDNKNVYLAETVKLNGGSGTLSDPYILINNDIREKDKKVIAIITYKDDNNTTIGTQRIYYNETNYISKKINNPDFVKWTDGVNDYILGNVTSIASDINLTAVMRQTLLSMMMKNADTTTQINFGNTSGDSNGKGLYRLRGTENDQYPIYYYRGNVNNNNVIFGGVCWKIVRTTDTGGVKLIYSGNGNGTSCENVTYTITSVAYNYDYASGSDVGYMHNKVYTSKTDAPSSNVYFGTGVEYGDFDSNGSSEYRLTSTGTSLDSTHHYTCDLTSSTGTCDTVRYYYYYSGSNYSYIELTDGETVEDALYKMTGTATDEVKARPINQNYSLNNVNSNIKDYVDDWYRNNLTNEVNQGNTNYTGYLEDTIWCNNRSFPTTSLQSSGWNPNGGSLATVLKFDMRTRVVDSWFSTTNVPKFDCPNETDRFMVSNTKAKLDYPVGLLTADEMVLAGAAGNSTNTENTNYYLYPNGSSVGYNTFFAMTPSHFMYNAGIVGRVYNFKETGAISGMIVNYGTILRPVVSLKLGTEYQDGGEGTLANPYVIKYN